MEADPIRVRPARPSDAPGIVELFQAVYGDAYPFRFYYDARELARRITGDDFFRVVAVDKQAVLGHAHVRVRGNYVYLGGALTLPGARRQGVHQRLIEARLAYGETQIKSPVFFSEPVTGHAGSQRNLARNGFVAAGFEVGKYPRLFPIGQRESVVIVIADPHGVLASSSGQVYVTPEAAACVQSVLDGLQVSRCVHTEVCEPARALSQLHAVLNPDLQVLTVHLDVVGRDVARCISELLEAHGDVFSYEVRMDAGTTEVPYAMEALREMRFYVSGFLPLFRGKDRLHMSRCDARCELAKLSIETAYRQGLEPFIGDYVRFHDNDA